MADQQKDSANDMMYILFAIVALLFGIYYFFGHQLVEGYLTLKLWELKIINSIVYSDDRAHAIHVIQTKAIGDWKLANVMLVGSVTGKIFNVVYVIILGFFTYKVWTKNPMQKFKRILNMQTLKESEQRLWPYIAPVVNIDLMKEPFDSGPYAMAMRPYDYAVKHKLLQDERNIASMDKVKAEKLFTSQLDKLWGGFNRLKKHEQALFVIMAAHGCGDKKGAMDAIGAIAQSAAQNPKKMPDFSSVKPLLKYVDDPRVQAVVAKHAYVYTVLSQMVEFARGTGVFPPSYVIWLKPRDRILWYVIDCVGRQTPFVEVAGIFGHWRAEQIAHHKLEAAYVAKAVLGLEKALSEVKIVSK